MTSPAAPGGAPLRTTAAAGLIAAFTVAIYWRAIGAGFVGDDFMILHRVRLVESTEGLLRFFRGEFFDYYRPLAFVLHTIDWWIAGADPRQFHITNLGLHAVSAVLVLLIGRALSPRSLAGPLASLLFALHASNHEAVVWVSARFDLLATMLSLAAIWLMLLDHRNTRGAAPALFFAALLSKESAVALPIAAAGFAVFVRRAGTVETTRRLVPWLAALVLYSALRQIGGGVSAVGGPGRLPKLVLFLLLLAAVVLLADGRASRLADWLRARWLAISGVVGASLALAAAVAATGGRAGQLAAEKLAVAGFVGLHLASPVIDLFDVPFYLDPRTVSYWAGGVVAVTGTFVVIYLLRDRLLRDERMWFLACFLSASLLPISALTEGTRYLYLPSAAVALIAGVLIAEYRGRWRRLTLATAGLFIVVSALQISLKLRDWVWAGQMTRAGAALVEAARAPGCGGDHVVFLTSPVAVRGVYTHFYYETFELPRGCMPEVFQVLTRVMRVDGEIDVRWEGPSRIVITAPAYRDNFVVSSDLRHFDRQIRGAARTLTMMTPLGELRAEPLGDAQRLTLTLAANILPERILFFYYSDGRMRALRWGG